MNICYVTWIRYHCLGIYCHLRCYRKSFFWPPKGYSSHVRLLSFPPALGGFLRQTWVLFCSLRRPEWYWAVVFFNTKNIFIPNIVPCFCHFHLKRHKVLILLCFLSWSQKTLVKIQRLSVMKNLRKVNIFRYSKYFQILYWTWKGLEKSHKAIKWV